ncbi:hypothetical protein ACLOJK_007891 [Asimina triloba]
MRVVMFFRFVTSGEIRRRSEFFAPFILGLTNGTVDQEKILVGTWDALVFMLIVLETEPFAESFWRPGATASASNCTQNEHMFGELCGERVERPLDSRPELLF